MDAPSSLTGTQPRRRERRLRAAATDLLNTIGDCGSCTSCCIRDAVHLELRGIPTAVVVTTEFVREAELQQHVLGMNDLDPIVIKHPVSSITATEIAERVEQIFVQARKIWLH